MRFTLRHKLIRFSALVLAVAVMGSASVVAFDLLGTPTTTHAAGSAGRQWPWDIPATAGSGIIGGFTDSNNNFVVVAQSDTGQNYYISSYEPSGKRHYSTVGHSTGSLNALNAYGVVGSGDGAFLMYQVDGDMRIARLTSTAFWEQGSNFQIGSAARASDGDGIFALGKGAVSGGVFWWDTYGVKKRSDGSAAWNYGWGAAIPTPIMPGIPGQVVAGNAGNSFFIAENQRAGDGFNDGYRIQQISSTGVEQWGTDGKFYQDATVSRGVGTGSGLVGSDGLPVYVLYYDGAGYVQKFDASGNRLWGDRGKLIASDANWSVSLSQEPTSGDYFYSWVDDGGNLLFQRLDATGNKRWASDVQVGQFGSQSRITDDAQGGAIISWEKYNCISGPMCVGESLRIQRIDSSGAALWDTGGYVVQNTQNFWHALAKDGSGGAFISWMQSTPTYGNYTQRIGAAGNVPAEFCSDGVYGHTVDYKRSTDDELVGGSWGWKFGGGSVSGTDHTRSVWIAQDADRFIVGGKDGWQVRTGSGTTLATGTDDVYAVFLNYAGTRFMIGGKNGWKYGNVDTGAILRSGADHTYAVHITSSLFADEAIMYGGQNGWKKLNPGTGSVIASGSQEVRTIAEEEGHDILDPLFGGPDGAWYIDGTGGTAWSTANTRTVAGQGGAVAERWRGGPDGLSDGFGAQFMSGANVSTLSACLSNCNNLLRDWIGRRVFGGMWGWGWISTRSDLQWTGDSRPTTATEWRSASDYLIYGGNWGWEVKWDENMNTPVKQGTENVVSCLGREVPIPPNPPPTPPNTGSGAKKLSVYDGVVWIVGGAPPYSAMKLGEAGRDIASTGNIYFSGNSADSGGAYFSGLAGVAAQRLSINAGMGGFPALELHSTASPALSVQQDNTSGRAVLFMGDVYVSGQLRVINGGTKLNIVQTPSGERKLYATEAPDARFSDYGTGKLENGVAYVQLDPTFAETLSAEPYHVNLTAQDTPTTLSVIKQDASGFDVRGAEDVSFYYEVVGLRKGFSMKGASR